MKSVKVNNIIIFFVFRYILIIFFCFLTMYITGRIADMDVLLGWRDYPVGGLSTKFALNIFSRIGGWGNRYFLITIIGFFLTLISYLMLKNNIDKNNFKLWKIILLVPGILIYSNSPTKETLFLYPAILYIVLECNYLVGKKRINLLNFFFKIPILILMLIVRSDLAIPYLLLSIISFIIKNFQVGKIHKRLSINVITFQVFLLSILTNIFVYLFFPNFIERLTTYVGYALAIQENIYRPDQFLNPLNQPLTLFYTQYLSLFPTVGELLEKPYLFIIVSDSIMIIYCFVKSWKNLFDTVNCYEKIKKIILILFTYVSLVYFSFFSLIGSVNLGASQRFRVNYIPLGIIFPLILEKKFRDKETTFSLKSKNIY